MSRRSLPIDSGFATLNERNTDCYSYHANVLDETADDLRIFPPDPSVYRAQMRVLVAQMELDLLISAELAERRSA